MTRSFTLARKPLFRDLAGIFGRRAESGRKRDILLPVRHHRGDPPCPGPGLLKILCAKQTRHHHININNNVDNVDINDDVDIININNNVDNVNINDNVDMAVSRFLWYPIRAPPTGETPQRNKSQTGRRET